MTEQLLEITSLKEQVSELEHCAELELVLEAERLQLLSIFDSMDAPIHVSDITTYEVLYANNAAIDMWGDIIGTKCHKSIHKSDQPCIDCSNGFITGNNFGKTHTRETYNSANEKWYKVISRAIIWPDGTKVRFELSIDISDAKEDELKMKLLLEELKQKNYKLARRDKTLEALNELLDVSTSLDNKYGDGNG